jgi:hypothetical protein
LHRSLKRNVVIALAALAVAACAGGAYAATQNSGPTTRQAFLNDVAKRLHVTPKELSSALNGAAIDQLQAEVTAGRLTQAQANQLEQRLKNGATAGALPFGPGPVGPRGLLGPPRGYAGPGGPGPGPGFGFGFGFGGGPGLVAAAKYLGLSDMQLFQQLSAGKSLAQIAAANGKTVAGLEQAMTAQVKKALDAAVGAKAITGARESQILDGYSARLKQEISEKGLHNARRPFFRERPYGGGPGLPAIPVPPNMPAPHGGAFPVPPPAPTPPA